MIDKLREHGRLPAGGGDEKQQSSNCYTPVRSLDMSDIEYLRSQLGVHPGQSTDSVHLSLCFSFALLVDFSSRRSPCRAALSLCLEDPLCYPAVGEYEHRADLPADALTATVDFPKKGIVFLDIFPLLRDPIAFEVSRSPRMEAQAHS